MYYKIIGKCPFGTCRVDDNGRMDDSQFRSSDPDAYAIDGENAILAIQVAQQYGAKPICQIEADGMMIDVYRLANHYGIVAHLVDGWIYKERRVFINTVSPAALVNAVRHELDKGM